MAKPTNTPRAPVGALVPVDGQGDDGAQTE